MTLFMALFIPAGAALLIAACHRRPNLREAVTLVASAALFLLIASLWSEVLAGARPALVFGELMPGLDIRLELEPLGLLFALVASGLWFVSGVYSSTRRASLPVSRLPSAPHSASRWRGTC
jgi:multicomponent Na+:H+ antiporter subunit D